MRKCQGHTIDSSEISIGHYRCYCILHDIDMTFTLTWLLGEISLFVCQSSLRLGLREKCHIIITNLHQTGGLLGIYFYVSFMSVFDIYGIYFVKAKYLASVLPWAASAQSCVKSCCEYSGSLAVTDYLAPPRGCPLRAVRVLLEGPSVQQGIAAVRCSAIKPNLQQLRPKVNTTSEPKHYIIADNSRPMFY